MARFTYSYEQRDYGTERLVTVKDGDRIIGQADPFPNGIPVSKRERQYAITRCARRLLRKYEPEYSDPDADCDGHPDDYGDGTHG